MTSPNLPGAFPILDPEDDALLERLGARRSVSPGEYLIGRGTRRMTSTTCCQVPCKSLCSLTVWNTRSHDMEPAASWVS